MVCKSLKCAMSLCPIHSRVHFIHPSLLQASGGGRRPLEGTGSCPASPARGSISPFPFADVTHHSPVKRQRSPLLNTTLPLSNLATGTGPWKLSRRSFEILCPSSHRAEQARPRKYEGHDRMWSVSTTAMAQAHSVLQLRQAWEPRASEEDHGNGSLLHHTGQWCWLAPALCNHIQAA